MTTSSALSSNTLDPSHPFEAVLLVMAALSRRKQADYARDTDLFSNFRETAVAIGIPEFNALAAVEFNIAQKEARLRALRANGRMDDPANESVADTLIDRAVYAVIAVAVHAEMQDAIVEPVVLPPLAREA